ncbi:MAG: O-antigen ligase family protein [Candidatus Falkowbacteria bacterium]|nr:O-antigen ligase family protein [Candidatus Falkowbacteria bacterium]
MDQIIKRKYLLTLLAIFLLEAVSFFGYLNGAINVFAFLVLSIIFIFLCIYRFHLALLVALVELIIGSKGYLFYFDLHGPQLSIRITFWLILMIFWLLNFSRRFLRDKKQALQPFKNFLPLRVYAFLAAFVVLGVGMALIRHNAFANWFFDLNAWLYFLIIFPWIDYLGQVDNRQKVWSEIITVSAAAISWLAIKSLVMLYIFTHFSFDSVFSLYRWIRTTGVGEVTLMPNGFYRVFFQSQIYLVFSWFFAFFIFKKSEVKKTWLLSTGALAVSGAVILLSFSRSFWIGIFGGILAALMISFSRLSWKKWLKSWMLVAVLSIVSFILVLGIAKFPFPKPTKDFSASSLAARAEIDTNEAALASRWSLLPELWSKIKSEPVLGSGFGTTVTYRASDPRVLEINSLGTYTTYAFEWGWLDLWLKFGLFGVLAFVYLLVIIIRSNLRLKNVIGNSFAAGLIALMALHTFTPYLNHPLGIMFIVLASLYPAFQEKP